MTIKSLPSLARATVAFATVLLFSACTTVIARAPVPEASLMMASPYGIESPTSAVLRTWGDDAEPDAFEALARRRAENLRARHAEDIRTGRPLTETGLLLSGGGPDGAFGAGLLKGWTERGDRPEFDAVTGVSTGAIIALFAFLGPEYDDDLEQIYTTYRTDQLATPALFTALLGGTALTDTRGYRALIEQYVNDAVVEKVAEEFRGGRVLLIGTTNIDASRPVIWNIGAIAASGHPDRRRLIHDIIQASSAIPAAFPPVLIPVETAEGRRYDEMHVDGGATQQVMLLSPGFPLRSVDKKLGYEIDRDIYVVMNNKLLKPYEPVRPRIASIAARAASSLIGGSGGGDLYRIFAIAQRDDIAMHITAIPTEFDAEPTEAFDPVYMKALFDLGYRQGLSGEGWSSAPPDFAPWP
jgi:predicted acylesterase/phospholipase RssA